MTQLEAALAVIAELNRRGHEAFLVGGCVRDLLIGRTPKDYDVTTHATPQQVMAIFPKTVPVGVSFGVVTVVMDGINTEVATFRADGEYSDARHPDCVHYSETAEEDVVRRDFTMNGLLIRLQTPEEEVFELGEEPPESLTDPRVSFALMPLPGLYSTVVVDFVGGRKDINDKVIRAIGNPEKRFTEDALRMLRVCRFAAQLGFAIEAETMTAMQKLAPTIKKVSEERISAELLKIVSSPNPVAGLVPLAISGLLDHMQINSIKPSMVNILRRFSMFPTDDPAKGMAMLLCELVSHPRFMLEKKMKLPLKVCDAICGALDVRLRLLTSGTGLPFSRLSVCKRLIRTPGAFLGVALYRQDILLGSDFIAKPFDRARIKEGFKTEAQADELSSQLLNLTPEEISPKRLVTGDDLIELGLAPGKDFKHILDTLENFQLDGEVTTREMMVMNAKDMVKACKNGTL